MESVKFQVWQPLKKRMGQVWDIGFKAWDNEQDQINYVKAYFDDVACVEEVLGDQIILRQFTGATCKGGHDVYTGDVLSYDFYKPEDDEPKYGIVKFDKYTGFYLHNIWMFNLMNKNGPEMWENQELLGNIYENPEYNEEG